jgi:tRNA 2-selenouridine synthase
MQILLVDEFIRKFENESPLLIDSRSEGEYLHAHFPGAINIPLLNNEHRHLVGTEYKKNGREAAALLGFKLAGPLFHEFIEKAKAHSENKEAMVYCWRGGMRSSIMSWILSMAGFKVTLLKGGYKSFRNFILDQFNSPKQLIIIGGHTGCGKTDILKALSKMGEQVIDLEDLAHHKGSAFGALGLPAQPSNEFFENKLGLLLNKIDDNKNLYLEAESHSIGRVKIPDLLFDRMQSAPLIEISSSREYRTKRIIKEYGSFPKSELAACTEKIRKRLGNLRLTEALEALEQNNFDVWVNILMDYYDKTYQFSLGERKPKTKILFEIKDEDQITEVAKQLLQSSGVFHKQAM